MANSDLAFLATLEQVILDRIRNPCDNSYTAQLIAGGKQRVAQKVGEEAVELAIATVAENRDEVVEEAADLVYHLMVLLHAQDLDLGRVVARLQDRHADSREGR